ncbi:MAG: MFS transporter [Acidobacteriaceae bacterium]|nr:MFS transporter [Acidobacteriaceae bacterium]
MQIREASIRYEGWRVTAAASGAVFFSFASVLVYTFGVFLKPIAAEFHWSREAVSAAFGFAAISVALCSPILGVLLDRIPPRRIILPCFAVFGAAFASLANLTHHIWRLYAVFVLLGIVGNGTAHLAYTGALATWFREKRGLAFALLMSGGALGAVVWPPIAQALISSFNWRTAALLLGLSILLFALPLAFQVKRRSGTPTAPPEPGQSTVSGSLSRPFWIIVVVLFAASLSQNGAIAHLAALLTDRGISPKLAAGALSVLGGATLLGRLITGWLLDRYFAPRVAVCLLAFAALGTYLLAIARSGALGYLGAALIGVGMGGEADITPYLLSRYFGLKSFSALYGFSWTAYALAGALGPVIMGRAFDVTGSYQNLLTILAALTLAAGCLMLFLPAYREPETADSRTAIRIDHDLSRAS